MILKGLRNDSLADSTVVEKGKEIKKKNCHIYIRDLNSDRDFQSQLLTVTPRDLNAFARWKRSF